MRRVLLVALAIGLVLSFAAILFWQDLIHELILVPISYLLWLVGLLYHSFDQQIWWTTLLIMLAIIAWTSLRLKPKLSRSKVEFENEMPHRVRKWRKRLKAADQGTYMKWRLAQHLSVLVIEAMSYRSGLPPQQIEKKIEMKEIDLPDDLVNYLRAARGFETASTMSRRWYSKRKTLPLDISPDTILIFLEEYLGIDGQK